MNLLRHAAVFGTFALGSAVMQPVCAQSLGQLLTPFVAGVDQQRGASIGQRPRTEYDPLGIRSGEFIIRPHLDESIGFDSNVIGTRPSSGSFFVTTAPQVDIVSNFSRNALRGSFGLSDQQYFNQSRQSVTDWHASLGGDYQIGQDVATVQATESYAHQTPGGVDSASLLQPLGYKVTDIQARYTTSFFRWRFEPLFEYVGSRYDPLTVAGASVSEKVLDRDTYVGGLTTRFGELPERSLMLVLRASDTRFIASLHGAARPDSQAFEALVGSDYLISGNLQVLLLLGYEIRQFSNSAYRARSSPVGQASVVWTPTGLTTVILGASRSVEDVVGVSPVGLTDTIARLTVDHEYRRNFLLGARTSIDYAEFGQGGGHQTLVGLGASASYLFNRNLRVTTSYDFYQRTGGTPTQSSLLLLTPGAVSSSFGDYNRHIAMVTFRFSL